MTAATGALVRGSDSGRPGQDVRHEHVPDICRAVVVGIWFYAFLSVSVGLAVWLARGAPQMPLSFAHGAGAIFGLAFCGMAYATLGALLAERLHRNPIGWLMLLMGVLVAQVLPVTLLVSDAMSAFRAAGTPLVLVSWLVSAATAPFAWALLTIAVMLFPTGRAVSPSLSFGPWVAIAGAGLMTIGTALGPTQLFYPALPTPNQLHGVPTILAGAMQVVGMLLLLVGSIVATSVLVVRWRAANPMLRAQLRWIVVASVVLLFVVAPFYIARYGLHTPDDIGEKALMLCTFGGIAFPLAVTIGMVRYDLYELDRVISRTLVYVPLTAILAGSFAASVALFQRLFIVLTGDSSDAAVILTTLLLASAFTPVKSALDGFVARRFPAVPMAGVASGMEADMAERGRSAASGDVEAAAREERLALTVAALAVRVAELESHLSGTRETLPRRSKSGPSQRGAMAK